MTLADIEFNIRGELSDKEDILRCLQNLFMTPVGTVPLDRDFGIDNSILDRPMNIAKNLFTVEAADKVRRYEPRVSVQETEITATNDGAMKVKVVITNA